MIDKNHLAAPLRYVEVNPARASLCDHPGHWRWSSAGDHLTERDDLFVSSAPMLKRFANRSKYHAGPARCKQEDEIRRHRRTGRPARGEIFVSRLEVLTGRRLWPTKEVGELSPELARPLSLCFFSIPRAGGLLTACVAQCVSLVLDWPS